MMPLIILSYSNYYCNFLVYKLNFRLGMIRISFLLHDKDIFLFPCHSIYKSHSKKRIIDAVKIFISMIRQNIRYSVDIYLVLCILYWSFLKSD